MTRRKLAIFTGAPTLLVVALLIWATASAGGTRGRPGVNDDLGQVAVTAPSGTDFRLTTLAGDQLRLSDLRGGMVMVDFWSSWCPPCIQEGPVLARAYEEWRQRGVEFFGIAIWDEEAPVREFIATHGAAYPNAIDATGATAIEFGVRGLPEKFFVDRDGRIVDKYIGPMTPAALDEILQTLTGD